MHYFEYMGGFGAPLWLPFAGFTLAIIVVWSIFWKGLALWHAAQRGEQWWFVAFLFVNTAGILEIVYLFAIAKLKLDQLFSNNHHHHSH
jgi:hypothetical protein